MQSLHLHELEGRRNVPHVPVQKGNDQRAVSEGAARANAAIIAAVAEL